MVFGDLLVVPVEDGFLYVQPVFVESNQGGTVIPELKKVVVVHGQTVTISDSLVNALAASFGEAPVRTGRAAPPGPDRAAAAEPGAAATSRRPSSCSAQGDLAGYQREIDLGQQPSSRRRSWRGRRAGLGNGDVVVRVRVRTSSPASDTVGVGPRARQGGGKGMATIRARIPTSRSPTPR